MNEIGDCTHTEAMDMIRSANTVTILSYEEAIGLYLRARGILNDGNNMLGDLVPLDWKPKEQIRRLQETVDRKQAAKLLLQKDVAGLRQEIARLKTRLAALENPKGAVVEAAVNNGTGHYIVGDPAKVISLMLDAITAPRSDEPPA